jgi:hypothetical protein
MLLKSFIQGVTAAVLPTSHKHNLLFKGNLVNSQRYNMTMFCFQHIKDFEDLVRTVVTLCDQEEQVRYVK